ncbi:MAG: hypothetical protein IT258_13620, partial [Saprospiraceae bacterium]|nr:hypothetical protein [Saprospiraceae bacterium]
MKKHRIPSLLLLLLPALLFAQQQSIVTVKNFDCASDDMMQSRPDLLLKQQQLEEIILAKKVTASAEKSAALPYVLPVVVHIIHNNGSENIPDAQVITAIEHLNQAFAHEGYYAQQGDGTTTQIQFCLARRDPDGNATTGITRTVSQLTNMVIEFDDLALKDLNSWDPTQYVNIWVVAGISSLSSGPGVAGYAYLASAHGAPYDGLVCEAQYFGQSAAKDAVLIHEIGHYLNLYHTFQGGCPNDDCQTNGDHICDTPPDQATHTGCVNNSCSTDAADATANNPFGTDVNDATENFMDYSPFQCYRNFTEGQGERMRATMEEIRGSLLESMGCIDPCTIPITAAFSASTTAVSTGETVVFTNLSTGANAYEWSVNGSVFSNLANPSYTFQDAGFFEIKLRVYNSDPNCAAVMKMVINVSCSIQAGFTVSSEALEVGEILNCTNTTAGVATQQQWYINGVAVGADTDMSYTFSVPGFYTVLLQTGNSTCMDVHSIGINVTDPTGCPLYQDGVYLEMNVQGYKPIYFDDLHPNGTIYRDYYGVYKSTVIKTDLVGNLIWAKNYNHNFGRYMVTDDGGILGYFFGGYLEDPTFVKLSPEGNVDWVNQINYSVPPNLYYRPMGNKAFIFSESLFDPFQVVLFAEDGSVLWNKSYETLDGLHMQDACASYDNAAIWISGSSWISTDGGVILKMDNQGNPIFIKKFSANPDQHVEFMYIKATPDNGFVALGRISMAPNNSLLLVKGDANGNIQWAKMVDLEEDVAFTWLFVKPDGGYWAGSHTSTAYRPVWLSFSDEGELLFARETYHVDGTPAELRAVRSVLGKPYGMLRLYYKPEEDPVVEMSESDGVKLSCITHKEVVEPCVDFTFTVSDIVATPSQQILQITGGSLLEVPLTTSINKLSLCDGVDEPCPEDCTNALDDDEDGYVDCFDSDCQWFNGVDCSSDNSLPIAGKIAWTSDT